MKRRLDFVEGNEEDRHVGGGDTADARGLSDGAWTHLVQFLARLVGEGLEGEIIEVVGQLDILEFENTIGDIALFLYIALVLQLHFGGRDSVGTNLFGDGRYGFLQRRRDG